MCNLDSFRCKFCGRQGKRYYAVNNALPLIIICGSLKCQLKAWLKRWKNTGQWTVPWDPWGEMWQEH